MLKEFDTNLFGREYIWYVEDGVWKLRQKVWTDYPSLNQEEQ